MAKQKKDTKCVYNPLKKTNKNQPKLVKILEGG